MWLTWVISLYFSFQITQTADPSADRVKSLPGLTFKINYNLYSGYLNAGNNGTWKMHYWLVESKTNPSTDPILVWFNGGPGCSSFGGAFEEMGPFYVSFDGKSLFENKFSWNYRANMLFLESPIGVGFSYDSSNLNFSSANDDQSRDMNYNALADFFRSYPQYGNRSYFLSGESYAGVYIPMLTARLAQGIADKSFPNTNFQGAAIGNGYMDVVKLFNSLVLWSGYHGRVSMQEWDFLKTQCNADIGQQNDMDTYNFFNYLRTPNYLDFYSDGSTCGDLILRLVSVPDVMDPYNYYEDCFDPNWQVPMSKRLGGKSLTISQAKMRRIRKKLVGPPSELAAPQSPRAQDFNYGSSDPYWGYGCWNEFSLTSWVNTQQVQKALNIDPAWMSAGLQWNDCSDPIYKQYNMTYKEQNQFFDTFFDLNQNPNFRFLIYNGDVDTVCNYLGDAWFIRDLAKRRNMNSTDRIEWWFASQSAGYSQRYTHSSGAVIDIMTVKGAGHFVPTDRPGAARQMITNFLTSNAKPDYNSSSLADPYPSLSPMLDQTTGRSTTIQFHLISSLILFVNIFIYAL